MPNGPRRIRMDDRSWRYEWAASISPSRSGEYYSIVMIQTDLIFLLDCQNWVTRRCHGIPRPGGLACLLLSRSRSKSFGFLSHSATFQDQTNLGRKSQHGAGSGSWELPLCTEKGTPSSWGNMSYCSLHVLFRLHPHKLLN